MASRVIHVYGCDRCSREVQNDDGALVHEEGSVFTDRSLAALGWTYVAVNQNGWLLCGSCSSEVKSLLETKP